MQTLNLTLIPYINALLVVGLFIEVVLMDAMCKKQTIDLIENGILFLYAVSVTKVPKHLRLEMSL